MGIEQQTLSRFISDVESQIKNIEVDEKTNDFKITLNLNTCIAKATEKANGTEAKERKYIPKSDEILTKEATTIQKFVLGLAPKHGTTSIWVDLKGSYQYPNIILSSHSAVALLNTLYAIVALFATRKNWIIGSLFLFALSGIRYSILLKKFKSAKTKAEALDKAIKAKKEEAKEKERKARKEAANKLLTDLLNFIRNECSQADFFKFIPKIAIAIDEVNKDKTYTGLMVEAIKSKLIGDGEDALSKLLTDKKFDFTKYEF